MRVSTSFLPRLKREEGYTSSSFWDDAPGGGGGQWTWGYGTKAPGSNCVITMADAEDELIKEVKEAERDYLIVFQDDPPNLTQARYDSIIDMLFNLGLTRFSDFSYTIGSIKEGNWIRAAAHAQSSLWYRQVGGRAQQVVEEFRTGISLEAQPAVVNQPKDPAPDAGKVATGGGWILRLLGWVRQLLMVRTAR